MKKSYFRIYDRYDEGLFEIYFSLKNKYYSDHLKQIGDHLKKKLVNNKYVKKPTHNSKLRFDKNVNSYRLGSILLNIEELTHAQIMSNKNERINELKEEIKQVKTSFEIEHVV